MKKSLAVMLALIMVLCMIPTTAFAEAGDWDPLTNPDDVEGEFAGNKSFTASTTMEAGKDGYLRLMPTLDAGNYTYNAMAYCGAKAKSNNTSIVEVKSIEIGKWVGGEWNNADCLQVTVNPKAAGTTTVVINFYYTFSQSPNPLTNPNAKWFYGTSYYTINVTEPTKPNPPTPENTSKPVAGLTGEEAVQVHCTNSTANHADESYGLKPNSYTVSNVEGDATNGYTCTITVQSEKYVNDYNAGINVNHTLDGSPTGTIKLEWDGSKWKVDSGVPVVFNVKCDNTQPSTDKPEKPEPENTSKPVAGLTSKDAVEVECITKNSGHAKQAYQLIADSYDVGAVSGNKEKGYTCEITVKPEKYVDQYNLDIEGGHKLDLESQIGTIKLKWNENTWEVVSGVPVVFKVKCDNTQPPLDPITIEVSKKWEDDIAGAQSITVGLYANGIKVKNATIRPDSEGTWFHRFDNMPANDSNGNPINYTVKEENIPDGYTPHYFTSGAHYGKLVFRVKNVPTEKTGAIKVSKELSGEGAEKDKEFAFTVTLLEYLDSNEVLDGGEPGYYPLSGIYTFGGFEFRDGKVTFGLKGGESVTISGIPAEYDYTVTESNNAGYTVTSENDKGTIRAKGTAEVKFTNTKSAAPTVSPTPTPTPTPGGGNGGHWHPTTTPVPVIVIPPKTGDMTIWQSILHFLGIR